MILLLLCWFGICITYIVAQQPPFFSGGSYEVSLLAFSATRINVTMRVQVNPGSSRNRLYAATSWLDGATPKKAYVLSDIDEYFGTVTWPDSHNGGSMTSLNCTYANNVTLADLFDFSAQGWLASPRTRTETLSDGRVLWSYTGSVIAIDFATRAVRRMGATRSLLVDANGRYERLTVDGFYPMVVFFASQPQVVNGAWPANIARMPSSCAAKPNVCPGPPSATIELYRQHGNLTDLYWQLNDVNLASAAGEASWLCGTSGSGTSPIISLFQLTVDPRWTDYMLCNRGRCDSDSYGQSFGIGKQNNDNTDKCGPPMRINTTCVGKQCSGGAWYAFPQRGRCPPGQPLGTKPTPQSLGCTWLDSYTIKKSITVDCLIATTAGFSCAGRTLFEMSKKLEAAFVTCPDVTNRSVPHHLLIKDHQRQSVEPGMSLPPRQWQKPFRQPPPPRPWFETKQPTLRRRVAAARLPFVAYDYNLTATVMTSGGSRDLTATFEAPTASRPHVRSTFQWNGHTAAASGHYNGTLMWINNAASFADCTGFVFNDTMSNMLDLRKGSSWLHRADVSILNGRQFVFASLDHLVLANVMQDRLTQIPQSGYVLMITNMTGAVETMVMGGTQLSFGTAEEYVTLWTITTPFRPLGVVNETAFAPPNACIDRPDPCTASQRTVTRTVYNAHSDAPSLVGRVVLGDFDGLALTLVNTMVYYNGTFSKLTQWSVEANPAWTVSGSLATSDNDPIWNSYGEALGVGRTVFLPQYAASQCNASQPSNSLCSLSGCAPPAGEFLSFTLLGLCPPGRPIGFQNCTWRNPTVVKSISMACVLATPPHFQYHNTSLTALAKQVQVAFATCPPV